MNNTGWNDPLGGAELPYDGRSIWDRGSNNNGSSSSGGSGGSSGCGCGCGTGLIILAILGVIAFIVEMIHVYF